jgi:hypothetical protein
LGVFMDKEKKIRCNYTLDPEVVDKLKCLNKVLQYHPKYSEIVSLAVNQHFQENFENNIDVKNAWNERNKKEGVKVIPINAG